MFSPKITQSIKSKVTNFLKSVVKSEVNHPVTYSIDSRVTDGRTRVTYSVEIKSKEYVFNRSTTINIMNEFRKSSQEFQKEENVQLSLGRSIYAGYSIKMKIVVTSTNFEDSSVIKQNTELSTKVGFTRNVIGKKFTYNGDEYEVVDIRTRNPSYPVIMKCKRGTLKFSVASAKHKMGGDQMINRVSALDFLLDED